MSPSFVDELFAKLPAEIRDSPRVDFDGLDERTMVFVRFVIDGRSYVTSMGARATR